MFQRYTKTFLIGIAFVGIVAASAKGIPIARSWWEQHHKPAEAPKSTRPHAVLAPGDSNTLEVPDEVVRALGVKTTLVIPAPVPEPLKLDGSLFLNANRMVHVHTRFAGEVVELGELDDAEDNAELPKDEKRVARPIRFGDRVKKGQLLAVVWSENLGEKKSELIETLSRQRLDAEKAKRLEELLLKGAVPERSFLEAQRNAEADLIAVKKIERTLRSWRLTEAEIDVIRAEAEKVHQHKGQWSKELEATWARVEVRAPLDATIVEKNIAIGDLITTDQDMFKIADLARLDVLTHVYEEDLPDVESLPRDQRRWTIFLRTDSHAKPLEGSFEHVSNIIDQNQHTALIMGWVDNSSRRLRVGQFVTANINLPAGKDEVAIPISAIIDEDGVNLVLVKPDPQRNRFTRRQVLILRRCEDLAYVSNDPPAESRKLGIQPLHAGEFVVVTGELEMNAELSNLKADNPTDGTTVAITPPAVVP